MNQFVDQIRDELARTTNIEKERSVGRVELENQSTWPQKGAVVSSSVPLQALEFTGKN